MGFFQQGLELIVQSYFVTPQLVLCTGHRPPEALFGMGHVVLRTTSRPSKLHFILPTPRGHVDMKPGGKTLSV
jgi:hypothetical protein